MQPYPHNKRCAYTVSRASDLTVPKTSSLQQILRPSSTTKGKEGNLWEKVVQTGKTPKKERCHSIYFLTLRRKEHFPPSVPRRSGQATSAARQKETSCKVPKPPTCKLGWFNGHDGLKTRIEKDNSLNRLIIWKALQKLTHDLLEFLTWKTMAFAPMFRHRRKILICMRSKDFFKWKFPLNKYCNCRESRE